MPKSYKAPNKRIIMRNENGRFRKTTMKDFGVGGVCSCGHLLVSHYNGDTRDDFIDPRKFIYRCFTCNPLNEDEVKLQQKIEASKPRKRTIGDFFKQIIEGDKNENSS